ncbi:acyltransferase [Butyrivibrio proteoclasticus B316]|uniref:Acyltransferase n=1 Tax=Butyrivibrio proteoclasticus (strain ATCC 51982 / DSM 14932 / B316) TaxID=515622 RepID=E0RZF2_BUTPB|nr:acyltransferase [Butyrivibrio proteoclasticus]ADL33149.1 acyltransferase [Butyrivibrio proteoclasticus B316]
MTEKGKSNHTYNYGLALLKNIMCFEVVLLHCSDMYDSGVLGWLSYLTSMAVPVFVIVAFYFTYVTTRKELGRRMARLYLPMLVWAVIYYIVFKMMAAGARLAGSSAADGIDVSINDFFWQSITGHSPNLNPPLWFNFVLLILTILVFLLNKIPERKRTYLLVLLFIAAIFMQYSGINMMLFGKLRIELVYSLGRITEMIPYMIIGIFAQRYLHHIKGVFWIPALISIAVIRYCGIFVNISEKSFEYAGAEIMLVSTIIFGLFYQIDGEMIPIVIREVIKKLSSLTMGIYVLHVLVNEVLCGIRIAFNLNIPKRNAMWALGVYVISGIATFLLSQIVPKKIKQYVM